MGAVCDLALYGTVNRLRWILSIWYRRAGLRFAVTWWTLLPLPPCAVIVLNAV
jgi:hypothetical protein